MKYVKMTVAALTTSALLAGCAAQPMGPTVAVMPGPNKPFAAFQNDDAACRYFAQQQVAGQAENANNSQVGTAIIGTVLGAGLGAALGGGRGAAVGAGAGALGGTAVGAGGAERAGYSAQQQYNIAYSQCMYAHGNQVQGYAAAPSAAMPPPPPPPPPPPYPPGQ